MDEVHMILCDQCKELHPNHDIYVDDGGRIMCCQCLGISSITSEEIEIIDFQIKEVTPDEIREGFLETKKEDG
jgi:hypothetical protein